jgi:hypothetical protein
MKARNTRFMHVARRTEGRGVVLECGGRRQAWPWPWLLRGCFGRLSERQWCGWDGARPPPSVSVATHPSPIAHRRAHLRSLAVSRGLPFKIHRRHMPQIRTPPSPSPSQCSAPPPRAWREASSAGTNLRPRARSYALFFLARGKKIYRDVLLG